MAQQVVIAGALFNDVPSISVPDSNSVWHQFIDTTITSNAAAAGDIAQGKLAYVNGSLVTGTNQGGGGGTLKVGVIRPDAVLEKSWTYDNYIVADEHVTIPSYSTSAQTLKAKATLETDKQLDNTQYDYFVTYRAISIPSYSTSTKSSGRLVYSANSLVVELTCVPSSLMKDGTATSDRYANTQSSVTNTGICLYWRSSSAVRADTGTTNGIYQTMTAPSFTTSANGTPKVTISSPSFHIKGSTTYLNSTNWGYLTDIRFQYIIQLWKVPRTGDINGWAITSQLVHAVGCAQSASGTLT